MGEVFCDTAMTCEVRNCRSKLDNCPNYRAYPRVYVQFNELVFNGIQSVETVDLTGDFKINTTPYPFRHGAYYSGSFKNGKLLMGEQDLSLDLMLPFVGLKRKQVLEYHAYIQHNLTKPGKLWAFDTGGRLIWAHAIPKHPPYTDYEIADGKRLHIPMDFLLPEGVWHVANTTNVFLVPYDMCDFKECVGNGCSTQCVVDGCQEPCDECSDCDDCEDCVCEEMAFCNTCWNPYDNCNTPYRIVYDCGSGFEFFGNKVWGKDFIQDCETLTGVVCSNATYDSPVTINLIGEYKNPTVEFNGVRIGLKGNYKGRLVFKPKGEILYFRDYGFKEEKDLIRCEKIPINDIIFYDKKISFEAKYGTNNTLIVTNGEKCPLLNTAFVKIDELTV